MNQDVFILGTGNSGRAAAALLARDGVRGRVCTETNPPPGEMEWFANHGFPCTDQLPESGADLAVISPGFPTEHPWLQRLRERGVPQVPEFELGAGHLRGKIVAVTGSLGKTSMVLFAAHLLRGKGLSVTVSGNIGTPVCETALKTPDADVHVMELSSFQTEAAVAYRPDAGILLNLLPNHLDRHRTMEAYARAKARMFAHQTPADLAVLPKDYPVSVPGRGRRLSPETDRVPDLRGTRLDHPALRSNLAALLTGLREWHWVPAEIRAAAETFEFPPHRMEEVGNAQLGRVINDSKSTCLQATFAALQGEQGRVHLIMGGVPKGDDPAVLVPVLRRLNLCLYLFGACAEAYSRAWKPYVEACGVYDDLEACLHAVFLKRKHTETLLFSPGCASFDQYSGYEARGRHFCRLVHARDPDLFFVTHQAKESS